MGQQLHNLQNCNMKVIIMEPSIAFDFLKAIKVHDGIFLFLEMKILVTIMMILLSNFGNIYSNNITTLTMHIAITLLTWRIC
jgi:hypothetical protein